MRSVALVALALAALLLEAAVLKYSDMAAFAPDVTLILVLFLGLNQSAGRLDGAAVVLILGYLTDLFAGSPLGFHMLIYAFLYIASRFFSQRFFVVRGLIFMVVTTLVAAVISGLLVLFLLWALFHLGSGYSILTVVLPRAAATALLALFLFPLLSRLYASLGGRRTAAP